MDEEQPVLAANEAFYAAFQHRDYAAMDSVWAKQGPVACIHPGYDALVSRADIMSSWADILSNPSAPEIQFENARVLLVENFAVVLCHEKVESTTLAATNVFRKIDGAWHIIHHQAGPVARLTAEPSGPSSDSATTKTIH